MTNPFDEPSTVHFDDGANEEIDSSEAAAILGVTKNNLRQLVFHKRLTVVKRCGRKAYFDRSDVVMFAATRKGS